MQNIIELGITELQFDPNNPRLPKRLQGSKSEADILEWMIQNENIIELMGSIGEKGYFPAEPLLVTKSKKRNFYEVIEGNRRLAALKLLNNPRLAHSKVSTIEEVVGESKIKPNTIPAILFETREEILVFLGYRHITGIKAWSSLAKAKYLEELRKNLRIPKRQDEFRTLAKIIGSKSTYVRSLLLGLQIYNKIEEKDFFGIKGLDDANFEFGVLYTAAIRKNISVFIGLDLSADHPSKNLNTSNLRDLTKWMFEETKEGVTRLGESRNLSDLDKILDPTHKEALKHFRQGKSLSEAVLLTDKPQVVFIKNISRALDSLKIARDQIHNIQKFDAYYLQNLEEISNFVKDLRTLIKGKISEEEA